MSVQVVDERRRHFAKLRDKNVFIYWPHGLGDWAHLALIVPFFERSNRYTVARYGDDYVALFEGNAYATPLYTGVRSISDGTDAGARHLGVPWKRINGRVRKIAAGRFESAFERRHFDAVLYTDYPERAGRTKYPFHTKARALLRDLVDLSPAVLGALEKPLRSSISFDVDREIEHIIDDRLRGYVTPGERLALIGRGGHTSAGKNWQSDEVAALRGILDSQRPRWRALCFEDDFGGLFGDLDIPFALVLKVLVRRAAVLIGVPAGPLHVALGHGQIPVVGIWLAHHPDWYEETSRSALHLLGKPVFDMRYDRSTAHTSVPPALRNRTISLRERMRITAADAWQAACELLR
ncbi:MAG TPA: hypothetical protein VIO32_05440 [Candidatus Baltobacteraceae bacterium]